MTAPTVLAIGSTLGKARTTRGRRPISRSARPRTLFARMRPPCPAGKSGYASAPAPHVRGVEGQAREAEPSEGAGPQGGDLLVEAPAHRAGPVGRRLRDAHLPGRHAALAHPRHGGGHGPVDPAVALDHAPGKRVPALGFGILVAMPPTAVVSQRPRQPSRALAPSSQGASARAPVTESTIVSRGGRASPGGPPCRSHWPVSAVGCPLRPSPFLGIRFVAIADSKAAAVSLSRSAHTNIFDAIAPPYEEALHQLFRRYLVFMVDTIVSPLTCVG